MADGVMIDAATRPLVPVLRTTPCAAAAGEVVVADTNIGSWTLTLPPDPAPGDRVGVYLRRAGGAVLTVSPGGRPIDGVLGGFVIAAEGTGRTLWYDGAGWVTAHCAGAELLAAPYTIAQNDVWEDTGLGVALPVGGAYSLRADVRVAAAETQNLGHIDVRLFDEGLGVPVFGTNRRTYFPFLAVQQTQLTAGLSFLYAVGGVTRVRLEALRHGGGAFTRSQVYSDSAGYTRLAYEKVV